ncbi:MAG: hypothetical protein ACR2OO_14560 [Thermomicrobiales bacterium]
MPRRPVLLLAALCVLMMPVNMRGGAEAAHPHAFFQFWGEDAEQIFRHHSAVGDLDVHAGRQPPPAPAFGYQTAPVSNQPCQSHAQRAPQFPSMEELGSPYEQASMIAAAEPQPFGAIESGVEAAIPPPDHNPVGCLDAPESPPPRIGVA